MKFFEFFAKRHLLANLFTLIALLLGAQALLQINRNMFPEVDMGSMVVNTVYPGGSAEDVELKVTNKIEDELKGISGIRSYQSTSIENSSSITIELSPDEERNFPSIKREIRDAVEQAKDLPSDLDELPRVTEVKTTVFPVAEIAVLSNKLSFPELRAVTKKLKTKLEDLSAISKVSDYGFLDREVYVKINPKLLKQYQVSLSEIISAIELRNFRLTGGGTQSNIAQKDILTVAEFEDPKEVGDVVVRSTFEGPLIRVKDLAEIVDAYEEEEVLSRVNSKRAISLIPYKNASYDVIRTVDKIKELIEAEKELAPADVEYVIANDSSKYIRNRFDIVMKNGSLGLILVVLFLAIFLNWRSALWVSVSIPFMLLSVLFVLNAMNYSLDAIMLMGLIIVIGIVVDDAIIVSESIHQQFEKGEKPLDAAVKGISRVFSPVLTTLTTTILAFSSMFFMPGVMGKFCRVIPLTITIALIVSLIEVVVALPAHLVPGLKAKEAKASKSKKEVSSWFDKFKKPYQKLLGLVLKFKYFLVLFFLAALIFSIMFAAKNMRIEIFPKDAADNFNIVAELPVGTSLKGTSLPLTQVEQIISKLPKEEVDSYATRIGVNSTDGRGIAQENLAVISVFLKPYGQGRRTAAEIIEVLREQTKNLKGFSSLDFKTNGAGPPIGKPITLRAVSADDQTRKALTSRVEELLEEYPGVVDISRDDIVGKRQLVVEIDYDKIARLGLSVVDVAQTIRSAYDGVIVATVRYGDEDVDFRVLFDDESRESEKALESILVRNNTGRLIELKEISKIEEKSGSPNIYHFNGKQATTIDAEVEKGKAEPLKVVNSVLDSINLDKDFPGASIVIDGEAQETKESMKAWGVSMLISLLAIYFVLILLFNSIFQPLLVLVAVPFGLIGVIWAVYFHGQSISFFTALGVIGLMGVVVNDSLVLVDHLNKLRKERPELSLEEVLLLGGSDRLRAIVMTSVTTIAGLLPLAYGIGGVDPFVGFMALALGWGLFLATPLTLFLVPCLYAIFCRRG